MQVSVMAQQQNGPTLSLQLYLIAQDLAANLEQGLQGRDHASNQGLILAMEEGNVVDDIQVALPHNLVSEVVRQLAKDGL